MQKTKLGISVGLVGAILYLCGYFSGYLAALLIAGYVLLAEENVWLKKTSVRVVVLMIGFSVLYTLLGLIPDLIGLVNSVFNVFGGHFGISFVTNIINVFRNLLDLFKLVVFFLLGASAPAQKDIRIPGLDDLIDKHMN